MSVPDASKAASSISVRFWGVRGSVPCPGPNWARYGGNTPCVEIRCGEHLLILDAGSGIRPLGQSVATWPANGGIDILLSHSHIDHVVGLPFFAPLYAKDRVVRVWAGHLQPACRVEDVVRKLLSFPLFPLRIEELPARMEFRDFRAGETISPQPGLSLRTAPLEHPGGATGYRIEYRGRSVAYLTDVEIGDGPIDPALMALAKDAELMILDTAYTDEELPKRVGWGHSSWQQGVRLADAAGVGRLCLFHHDPDHDDAFMDSIAAAANALRPGTIAASEGMLLNI
jgi:phosphoribosyl 1,2-cyclic phosphodiesterase